MIKMSMGFVYSLTISSFRATIGSHGSGEHVVAFPNSGMPGHKQTIGERGHEQ